jgi:tight adherence protein B
VSGIAVSRLRAVMPGGASGATRPAGSGRHSGSSKRRGSAHRRRTVAAAGAVAASLIAVGPVGTAFVMGGATVVVLARQRSDRTRQLRDAHTGVVDVCRATAAELRAGRPLADAFVGAARAGPPQLTTLLQPAITVGRRGDIADLANAVALVATNPGCAGLRRVAACWRVAAASGAALAPAIDRVADALQDEIDLGRDVTSTLAGPRATAHLLAGLPIIGLLLGTAIGAHPIGFLLGSGPGLGCLLVAVALDGAGLAWARRIAHRAARLG